MTDEKEPDSDDVVARARLLKQAVRRRDELNAFIKVLLHLRPDLMLSQGEDKR
jgi:hypothetical protein